MDFEKTSFSVDWFTPGDKLTPKRLSFPKSARISIDDLVSDSPLSFCFSPVDETLARPLSYSFADTPFEKACGWSNSAPPSPLAPSHREPPLMHDQAPKTCEESPTDSDWRSLASPGLLSVADDCALCGVDMDVSCLDALDEQLLVAPVECFTELCWQAAVRDEVTAPKTHRYTRSRARSFKCDHERPFPSPTARDYPGSFERTRPLAAKLTLPLDAFPHSPSSYSFESHDLSPTFQDKNPLAYIMYTDPEGRVLPFPVQDMDLPQRSKKRGLTLTPSFESLALPQPPKPRLQTSKSSQTLRVISDACATFTRGRRRSPH